MKIYRTIRKTVQRILPGRVLDLYHAVRQTLRRILHRRVFEFRLHRRSDLLSNVAYAWSEGATADDAVLIDRIIDAYRRSASFSADGTSMWRSFFHEFHEEIHNVLLNGPRSRVEEILRNPVTSDLFYGFDGLSRSYQKGWDIRLHPMMAVDGLLACAEAMGARRLENPEGYSWRSSPPFRDVDAVLAALDRMVGITLPIPNPYPREFGALTGRGILSYRVPQAIYQAWRLREITSRSSSPRVLEVGAGLGRTAFYAYALGLTEYTIVDLPITSVAQGYFLGRTLGADRVTLGGEPRRPGTIRIQTPETFHTDTTHYELVLNADSLTELDPDVARRYWAAFQRRADGVLSINHENNLFTVQDLIDATGPHTRVTRFPYWIRRGYVESEVIFNRPQT